MQLSITLRKVTELCIAISAITVLLLTGCGGGGIGSVASGGGGMSVTITPFKGPFSSGRVILKDANGALVTILSGETINASGVANITFDSNVTYPLVVEVTGNYYNEITGLVESAVVPLRGLITSPGLIGSGSAVPVTIITETAVADLQNRLGIFSAGSSISAASAVVAMQNAGYMFGISASAVPVFDPVTNESSDPDTLRLAALAVFAGNQISGTTLAEKVKGLAHKMATLNPASAPTDIINQTDFDNALTVVTSGRLRMMAAGTTSPTSSNIGPISMGDINTVCQTLRDSGNLQTNAQGAALSGANAVMGNLNVENVSGVPASSPLIYVSLTSLSDLPWIINPGSNVYVAGNTTVGGLAGNVPGEVVAINQGSIAGNTAAGGYVGTAYNASALSLAATATFVPFYAVNSARGGGYAVLSAGNITISSPVTLGLAGATTTVGSVGLTNTAANYAVGADTTILATDPALWASSNFDANNATITSGTLSVSGVFATLTNLAGLPPATFPSTTIYTAGLIGLNSTVANFAIGAVSGTMASDPALWASSNFDANNATITSGTLGVSGVSATASNLAELSPATLTLTTSTGLNGVVANSGVIVATGIPFICPQ